MIYYAQETLQITDSRPFPFKALTPHCRILDQHCSLNLIRQHLNLMPNSHGKRALEIQVIPASYILSLKYMQNITLIPQFKSLWVVNLFLRAKQQMNACLGIVENARPSSTNQQVAALI